MWLGINRNQVLWTSQNVQSLITCRKDNVRTWLFSLFFTSPNSQDLFFLSNFLMAKLWCLTIHFHTHREVLYKRNRTRQIRFFLVFRKFTKCIFWSLNKNLTTNTNMNKWTDVKSITHLLSFKALTSDCTQ